MTVSSVASGYDGISLLAGNAAYQPVRGVFGGGYSGSVVNVIDYVDVATLGNATDFGDLTRNSYILSACASTTRGLFGGGTPDGGSESNVIDYITIMSTGNATDFAKPSISLWRYKVQ